MLKIVSLLLLCCSYYTGLFSLQLGIERLTEEPFWTKKLENKRIGILTHQAAIDHQGVHTIERLQQAAKKQHFTIVALFGPEHGLDGSKFAARDVQHSKTNDGIPVFSLHGTTRRPTKEMLQNIDVLICDLQDIGCRSYTYLTTLCYVIEECAKNKVKVIVTDRPNPMGGLVIDGPILEEKYQSFVGYLSIPYVHGMTLGELARFVNENNQVHCQLEVVPMIGWTRSMQWSQTGLLWMPTSPQIPEADTPFYYATTGVFGEMKWVNIGVGYTLPFKTVAAPWIDASLLAGKLNEKKFPGVCFTEIHYTPFFGSLKDQVCHGIKIQITDPQKYMPVETGFLILGILKTLYPAKWQEAISNPKLSKVFAQYWGTHDVLNILTKEKYAIFPLKGICMKARQSFIQKRAKYLLPEYS